MVEKEKLTQLTALTDYIVKAEKIFVFTGAGISTNSGIPDYRGPSGVWKTREPVYWQDFMAREESRVEYWDYKLEGWETFRNAEPNDVHFAVTDIEKLGKLFLLCTQNIDGLHTKAGTSRGKTVEIHGTNSLTQCQSCWEKTDPEPHFKFFIENRKCPICHCGGLLKPATISFGQSLVQEDMERSFHAAEEADLVIAMGSSLTVNPAAGIALAGAQSGADYIIINRGDTQHDHVDSLSMKIDGDVSDYLPQAVKDAAEELEK